MRYLFPLHPPSVISWQGSEGVLEHWSEELVLPSSLIDVVCMRRVYLLHDRWITEESQSVPKIIKGDYWVLSDIE